MLARNSPPSIDLFCPCHCYGDESSLSMKFFGLIDCSLGVVLCCVMFNVDVVVTFSVFPLELCLRWVVLNMIQKFEDSALHFWSLPSLDCEFVSSVIY